MEIWQRNFQTPVMTQGAYGQEYWTEFNKDEITGKAIDIVWVYRPIGSNIIGYSLGGNLDYTTLSRWFENPKQGEIISKRN